VEDYGGTHLVMLAIFVAAVGPLIRFGRTHRRDGAARRLAKVLAILIPAFTIPMQVVDFVTNFDIDVTLPFHLCDLAWPAAAVALWTGHPYFVGLTYFWGLTLTIQAIITPSLAEPFPEPRFFAYWGMHCLVVWSALYLVWGLGLTPGWREYGTTLLTTLTWLVVAAGFNIVADTNYGYLCRKPTASILDFLGPWPWYVAAEVALVAAAWALMTWPWARNAAATPAQPTPSR
jgi:hypothetical integral membrane protein (TIGR02206 family)